MANIRTWLLRDHRHPLDSSIVLSREIHIEGQFSNAEWAQIHVVLATMKRACAPTGALPEDCIEAEIIPTHQALPENVVPESQTSH